MYDPGTLYVDPILTGFSVGYEDQTLFAPRFFPVTPVRTQSGRYRVFDRSNWLIFPSRREPGTVANEIRGGKWSEDTFLTKEHSLQAPIHDEERQELTSQGGLADPVFGGALQLDPERDATELTTRSIMLEWEQKVANVVRNSATYPGSHVHTNAGTTQWSDHTTLMVGALDSWATVSDPVQDIINGMNRIYLDTRRYPNTLAIPFDVAAALQNHPRIVRRFENFALTDDNAFQKLTGFTGQIFIVDSVYNSADNVDAAENIVSFWGQDVWLGIVDPTPGLKTRTFGKTFCQIYPDGTIRPTDKWREEPRKSDIVRVSQKYDLKVVSNVAGYLIKNAAAAL